MNKLFYCIIAVLLVVDSYGQIEFGIKGGLNLSNSKYDNFTSGGEIVSYTGLSTLPSFNVGGFALIKLKNHLFLDAGIEYSAEGYKFPGVVVISSTTMDYPSGVTHLNYINVPVLLSISAVKEKLFIMLGPQANFLVNANSNYNGSAHHETSSYNGLGASIDVGASYKITGKIGVQARYDFGLSGADKPSRNFDANGNLIGSTPQNGSSRVFQAGIFYLLG